MMIGDDSPGVASLPVEDGNATPAGSPAPAPAPSSPSPVAPSPVEEVRAGDGALPMEDVQLPSVVPNGGSSAMSNNVSELAVL